MGFGIETLRILLFAAFGGYPILIVGQCLGGISAASVTVLTVLMLADMTDWNRSFQSHSRLRRNRDFYRGCDQHRHYWFSL